MAVVGEIVPPEQRKPAFTLVRLAINLGMSVGPAVGGFLAMSSFKLLFFVDGATSIAACAVLALAPWRLRGETPSHTASQGTLALAAAHTDGRFLAFLAGVVIVASVFFQSQAAMPLFLVRELGFTEAVYGLLFAVNTLLIVVLEIPISSATAAWPHRVALAIGSLLYAIGFGALGLVEGLWSVAGTIVIWTFGEMLLMPAMSAYVTELAPAARRGEYMGLYTMAFSLAFTIAPGLGTEVLARFGSSTLWACCFATGVAGAVIFWRTRVPSA
jgi:MFS family permease